MPTIKLLQHKKRDVTYNKSALQKYYNTPRWKKLRSVKVHDSPLCEKCLRKNPPVITQTQEVHHKIPINITNPDIELIFDYDNLESICNLCHAEEQNILRKGLNPVEKQIAERREVR